ncbi:hypothetical protein Gotri_026732 [Gossypium trilobum]|uniref:Uncharacterized protein n=1 Tax=Gossypium trilobum TaxID=34281 RepID=A0A7J9FQ78_9ROSI|nr:hypothetical protein [Gossypium trilobum]
MTQREKCDSLVEGYVSELWDFTRVSWVIARIKQKGDSKCIPWKNLKDIILAHPDAMKKVDVFALSIYGLVVFPRHWDMLTRQSLTYLISLIREFHQSRIYKRRISSGELRGYFQTISYIDVGIFTGFLCLEFGELLVMPHC